MTISEKQTTRRSFENASKAAEKWAVKGRCVTDVPRCDNIIKAFLAGVAWRYPNAIIVRGSMTDFLKAARATPRGATIVFYEKKGGSRK